MESSNAAISIGGKIERSAVVELTAALARDSAAIDWTDVLEEGQLADHILNKVAAKDHLYFCNNDQPWGQYESTEAFCRRNGLIYVLEYEAGGDWPPGLEYHSPDMEPGRVREWPISEIGRGPLIDAGSIQTHRVAGTLADEIALMTTVHAVPWPLEIVEDKDLQKANRNDDNF